MTKAMENDSSTLLKPPSRALHKKPNSLPLGPNTQSIKDNEHKNSHIKTYHANRRTHFIALFKYTDEKLTGAPIQSNPITISPKPERQKHACDIKPSIKRFLEENSDEQPWAAGLSISCQCEGYVMQE